MRLLAILSLMLSGLWLTGCTSASFDSSAKPGKATMIPENMLVGKVVRIVPAARFVIITFPVGVMAEPDQRLYVYRGPVKVGELKVSGPPRDESIAADIMEGDCQVGDEVRDR